MAERTVYCEESVQWLKQNDVPEDSAFVTSLPDVSETQFQFEEWKRWFSEVTKLILIKCPPHSVAIFYQTDIKHQGVWVDKSYLCQRGAEAAGARLLWHKIVCRKPAGTVTFGRPGFAHLLCFSTGRTHDLSKGLPDVLPDTGKMIWSRAIGLSACEFACRYVSKSTESRTIVDPFCGQGTVLAVSNALNMNAIGVDWSRRRCARARALDLSL